MYYKMYVSLNRNNYLKQQFHFLNIKIIVENAAVSDERGHLWSEGYVE